MHMPGVLESAKQVAAVTFPENGRSPPAASSIPPCPPLPAPKGACPWPAAAAEAGTVAGKSGPQVQNELFMAFKSCVLFLMSVGVERGTFKTSTKIHSGLSVVCCFMFCTFSSCCSFVFPFEYCLLMGFTQGLVLAGLLIHLSQKCLLQWRLLAAGTPPTPCRSEQCYLWHLAFF